MFNLDEQYLRDLGIMDLPEDMRGSIVEGLEKQIQDRVSLKMAQGLTDEQLEEFADINEGDSEKAREYLMKVAPQFEAEATYVQAKESGGVSMDDLNKQFAQMKWLEFNVPNYSEIILETLNEVKEEILAQRAQVLGN
jgi:hypothetical protein